VNRAGGLVIDTFWDLPHTRELIAQYARVWPGPARRVVNTHHNGDHAWGNQLFARAEIIGHRKCAAAFGRERPELMQMLRGQGGSDDPVMRDLAAKLADWDFTGIELTPPTTLLDDRLDLDLDGLRVELRWVGPAHTAGDVIVHLPRERVVFTGDVLFRLCTPIGWDGTFDGWLAALDTIVALDPAVVVPGHGPLCGVEGPREMRAYLVYVRDEASRGFEAELSVVDTAKRIDLGPYAGWTEPERIVFQVERAYRELRGEAWDAPLDVNVLFAGMYELRQAYAARRAH
jgi:glyoxylase-like metal-dependent hydrolase (beta-lactamase superfamily II)